MQLGSPGQDPSRLGGRSVVPGCRVTKGIQEQSGRNRCKGTERVACLVPPSFSGLRGQRAGCSVQERDEPRVGGGAGPLQAGRRRTTTHARARDRWWAQ